MRVLRADLCRFIGCVSVLESVRVQGQEKREGGERGGLGVFDESTTGGSVSIHRVCDS